MSGKGRFAACGGKGAPVRGPFGGPRPTRPLRPAGRHPAHPGRRRGAARPACCRSRGHVAAKAAPSARPGQVGRQPLRGGHPSAMQGQAPSGRAVGPALHCSSPAPVAAQVLRGGPAPTSGGCGAVRPSGPVGGAAAPAQAAPRLRRWLRFGRAAYALAARRSGPPPLAAYGSQAGASAAACGLAPAGGRNLYAARKGRNALRAFAPYRAWRAAGARGNAACGRDGHACERRSRVKCTALRAALDRRSPARQRGIRRRGPLGPVTDPPPTERSNP